MEKKYYIFFGVVACFFSFLGFLLTAIFYCEECDGTECSLEEVAEEEEEGEDECDFYVDVSGAVMEPQVVCMQEGEIVNDAIQGAGNVNPQAYSFKYFAQRINLARVVEAEEKIYVPFYNDVVCKLEKDEEVERAKDVVEELDLDKDSLKGELPNVEEVKEIELDESESEEVESDEDCININDASQQELTELVGVGDARANDIIGGRPYSSIEDIKDVPGIGDATYDNIKDFICI